MLWHDNDGWWLGPTFFIGEPPEGKEPIAWLKGNKWKGLLLMPGAVHVPFWSKKALPDVMVEPTHTCTASRMADSYARVQQLEEPLDEQQPVLVPTPPDDPPSSSTDQAGPMARQGLGRWDAEGRFHKGGWLNRSCDLIAALMNGHVDVAMKYAAEYADIPTAAARVMEWKRKFA